MIYNVTLRIGNEELVLETGRMAKQANGAVFARYGGSAVLATVCSADKEEDFGYLPLSVEYNEKYYAAGKIPGGFLKREGRPHSKEILVSRLIDRPMRPLFPKKYLHDIQIIPTTVSADQINPPDVIGMLAASAAVYISDIPFDGPVSAVRIAVCGDEFIVNPTFDQIEQSCLDIIVAGTENGITMVEGGARSVSEELMLKAIEEAHVSIKQLCQLQKELWKLAGKEKQPLSEEKDELEGIDRIREYAFPLVEKACFVKGKMERISALKSAYNETLKNFEEIIPEEKEKIIRDLFETMESEVVRKSIFTHKKRTDGRSPDEIRDISCEIDVLKRTHGSALFTRGETQALVVTTLGTVYDEKILDDIDGDTRKTFILHYNFPPFSVGETGRLAPSRREIGHGHLAERAFQSLLPAKEEFPYTIRIVSEILESNGSSSMATVCGGTLSLLNAGVPIKKSVAGIAMGLIKEGDDFVILSDILGEEDHLGDMDFKVAGTEDGITAFQMDIKIGSVNREILDKALARAKEGRLKILDIMNQTIKQPRDNISEYAPKIIIMRINPDKIGLVIGPGGKTIRSLSEKFDSTINIESDGEVTIYCKNRDGAESTQKEIELLIEEPVVGKIYKGKIKRITEFGAFIEFLPGKEGLCHISKISSHHIRSVRDVFTEDQEVDVKLIEIDKLGRANLSHVDAIEGSDKGSDKDKSNFKPYKNRQKRRFD
ncbi:MAG: polyribonucleotide nucleotidyltransferase [Spirochaetales bacterium]|nr:polyribonucleotide nucleotidyltransferase [Spirochaetales bacterium]